ncbi:hypothetical protein KY349_03240 [Candidatus Woesearchaeota archaeon]|nr:hypothetical protein [Candidatus Woesearchaeota archaeon]
MREFKEKRPVCVVCGSEISSLIDSLFDFETDTWSHHRCIVEQHRQDIESENDNT